MKRGIRARIAIAAAALVLGAVVLGADVLVLRDGRRIEGQLLGVQGEIIQFREDQGGRSRTIEVRRDEVARIEFEERRPPDDRRPDRGENRPRPNGLREQDVWVAADRPWTDSGMDVRDGQVLYFDTHGGDIQWRHGDHVTAAGDPRSSYSARRPMPNRPTGALIAKIGAASHEYIFIGDDLGPVRMRGSGRLFFGINDDNPGDNQGAFRVTMYY